MLFGLHQRRSTVSAKHTRDLWILIKISLSLVVSQSLCASTEPSLLETGGRVVGLWVEQSIDILVTSRIASGIFVVKRSVSGWTIRRSIDITGRGIWLFVLLDGRWLFSLLLIIRIVCVIFLIEFRKMLDAIALNFR